jgi:hypothetical protein
VTNFHKEFLQSIKSGKSKYEIDSELECLLEIKDINDEIRMIRPLLNNQREVFKSAMNFAHRSRYTDGLQEHEVSIPIDDLGDYEEMIYKFCRRMDELEEETLRVEQSVR